MGMVDKKLTRRQPRNQLSGSGAVLACANFNDLRRHGAFYFAYHPLDPRTANVRAEGQRVILRRERDMKTFINMLKDEAGASAAEYALILAVIGSVIAIAALGLAGAIGGAMNRTSKCITTPNTSNC